MVIEISVLAIAVAFIALVTFLVITLVKLQKALDLMQSDLHLFTLQATKLLEESSTLIQLAQKKTPNTIEFLLSALAGGQNESGQEGDEPKQLLSPFLQWILNGLILTKKAKEVVKKYVK